MTVTPWAAIRILTGGAERPGARSPAPIPFRGTAPDSTIPPHRLPVRNSVRHCIRRATQDRRAVGQAPIQARPLVMETPNPVPFHWGSGVDSRDLFHRPGRCFGSLATASTGATRPGTPIYYDRVIVVGDRTEGTAAPVGSEAFGPAETAWVGDAMETAGAGIAPDDLHRTGAPVVRAQVLNLDPGSPQA